MRSRPTAESPATFTTLSEGVQIGPFQARSTVASTCSLVTTLGGSDTQPSAFRSWLRERHLSATFDHLRCETRRLPDLGAEQPPEVDMGAGSRPQSGGDRCGVAEANAPCP